MKVNKFGDARYPALPWQKRNVFRHFLIFELLPRAVGRLVAWFFLSIGSRCIPKMDVVALIELDRCRASLLAMAKIDREFQANLARYAGVGQEKAPVPPVLEEKP